MGKRKDKIGRISQGVCYHEDNFSLDKLDLEILKILSNNSLNQNKLSKQISFSYPALIRRIKKLEELGYVRKEIDKTNMHANILSYGFHIPFKDIEKSFDINFEQI
jgi:DNA-binding MarR family transcriptional regulator